jgi:hypothetical protein
MNPEMYIISETTRKAKRILSFNYNADRVDRSFAIDYNGDLSVNDYLNMSDTYRVLVMNLDDKKPYYQMNNVVLTSCKKGGFFATGNKWEYAYVAAHMTPFPEMNIGWDDFIVDGKPYDYTRSVNFEF